jgi:adenylate cyclase
MGVEIERKFLVRDDSWRASADAGTELVQGYLVIQDTLSVRVRIQGEHARLTIKAGTGSIERQEFEYPIPISDARTMIGTLCRRPVLSKRRHRVPVGRHVWEVDVFAAENAGLVVAEVELAAVDESFERPPWVGEEVSEDARYLNASLVDCPWPTWGAAATGR